MKNFNEVSPGAVREAWGVESAIREKLDAFLDEHAATLVKENDALKLQQVSIEFTSYLKGAEEYDEDAEKLSGFFKSVSNKDKQLLIEGWMRENGYKYSDQQVRTVDEDGRVHYTFAIVKDDEKKKK